MKLNTTAYVNRKRREYFPLPPCSATNLLNKKVLTVSKYGNMKGTKKGKATVTVKLKTGDISYKVKVTVK